MIPDELAARLVELRARSAAPRIVVGIAGAPGSGKTTIATTVVRVLAGRDDWRGTGVAYVPMDGFHLSDAELARLGRLDRKGAPDTFDAGGYVALLRRIRAGETVWAPGFDRAVGEPRAQALPVGSQVHTVVTEGNYLLLPDGDWSLVRPLLDEAWFCRTSAQSRRERLSARHQRFGKSAAAAREWVGRVDEPNAAAVDATEAAADLVIMTS